MDRTEKRTASQDRVGLDKEPDIANRKPPAGVREHGEITGQSQPGDDGETDDGLNETDEAVRIAAEDTASGDGRRDRGSDLPVFEAPLTSPKV